MEEQLQRRRVLPISATLEFNFNALETFYSPD
jgi:hypothetical protein